MSASSRPAPIAERLEPRERRSSSGTFAVVIRGDQVEQVRAKHLVPRLDATAHGELIPSSAVERLRAERLNRREEAAALVSALKRVDISQRLLAHFCGFSSPTTVREWCKGARTIQVAKLNALVDIGDLWREECARRGLVPR